MTAVPTRRRDNLLRVELQPGASYVFRIKRGDGPVHLSLDDGSVVTVGGEGEQRLVRVQKKVGGWVWRYEDEPVPVEWSFWKIPTLSGLTEDVKMVMGPTPYLVLVVDDDPDIVLRIQVMFARRDANARVNLVRSAEEAISYLRGQWPDTDYGRSRLPDVIVLDIKMPGIGGLGFLEWYHGQPAFTHIPVVVLTSEANPVLAQQCFALGAREFMDKSADFGELVSVVQGMLPEWPEIKRRPGADQT